MALSQSRRLVERPIFIVGPERSGTTLLRSLLSAHSRIAISPETHFMQFAAAWTDGRAEREFEAFWRALTRHLDVRATAVDLARCRALLEEAGRCDLRAVFAALLAVQTEAAGKRRSGEKTPGHEHALAQLFAWFPDAQAIFVHRDPRACAASALRTPWAQSQLRPAALSAPLMRRARLWHVAQKAQDWAESVRAQDAWRDDPRVEALAYENLIAAPERELRRLCAWLGEAFEPHMLEARACDLIDPAKRGLRWRQWTLAHERRAASDIDAKRLSAWRAELSLAETAVVEGTCEQGMQRLGYTLACPRRMRAVGRARQHRALWAERAERALRALTKMALFRRVWAFLTIA